MSYQDFSAKIRARFGLAVKSITHDNGRHIAHLSDGVKIIGNEIASSVQVKWGSGHSAYATL